MNQKSCLSYVNIITVVGLVLLCSILVITLMSGSNLFPTIPEIPLREHLTGVGSIWLVVLSIVIVIGFFLVVAINYFITPRDSSWSLLTIAALLVLPFAILCLIALAIWGTLTSHVLN